MAADDELLWYHGNLSREEAETVILSDIELENGLFLVRDSSSAAGDYVLSVYHEGEVVHYQIRRHGEDAFFSIDEQTITHGLETLIEYYIGKEGEGLVCRLGRPIKKYPPPHDTRRHGRTNLLHRATREGNLTVVSELLKCGYRSVEAKNEDGETAVHVASRLGEEAILEKLISSGANVNSRDQQGNTPLHYACQYNMVKTAKVLITSGNANVQFRNSETGWVGLHEAASRGHIEVVELLLSLNAPARPRTILNETPEQLAEANGHFQCAYKLKMHMASEAKTQKEDWYHGTLDRSDAIDILKAAPTGDGTFLVRYSKTNGGYVLTMTWADHIYHYIIQREGGYFVIDNGPYLDSVEHVVEHYSLMQDGLPTTLQHPVKPMPKPPLPDQHPALSLLSFSTLNLSSVRKEKRKRTEKLRGGDGCSTLPPKPKPRFSLDSNMNSSSLASLPLFKPTELVKSDLCIPEENIIRKQILGGGEFGFVYKAVYQMRNGTEKEVAVKTLHEENLSSTREEFMREARIMMGLDHHCIVKVIGLSQDASLLMELVPLGSMLNYLLVHPDQVSPEYELRVWASQIACGMQYLESERFVHRDLAARNILLATRHQAKISDFGLSRVVGPGKDYYKATKGGLWPIKWYAPEAYHYGTFSSASDVWSFGVTLWEMFSFGQQPFGTKTGSQVIELIEGGERLKMPEKCPVEVYRIMGECWAYSASERPSFKELAATFAAQTKYENVKHLISEADIS